MSMTTLEQDQTALIEERTHYEVMRVLGSPFNAIKYLYDRLNIIDSKTSALLRLNTLCFTIISLIVGAWLRPTGMSLPETSWAEEILFLGIVLTLVLSTYFCFRNFVLKFDHITAFDDDVFKTEVRRECQCSAQDPVTCSVEPLCNNRRFVRIEEEAKGLATRRSLKNYEDLFFEITIKRQRYLGRAIYLSAAAGSLFFLLLLVMSVPRLTHIWGLLTQFGYFARHLL